MNISIACILLGVVILANCQGDQSIFLAIENYITNSGEDLRLNCIKESGVPLEILEKVEKTGKLSEDKRFKCYVKCTFLASSFIDQKGVLNMDTMISLFNATNPVFIDKVRKNCKRPINDDLCESATVTCACVFTAANEEHIQV